jgi:hypothetical protein
MDEYEYILLKLVTAEVIIGRLDALGDDDIILEYPMLINYVDNPITGETRIYLTNYNPFYRANKQLYIRRKHIVFDSPVDDEYVDFYERYVARYLSKLNTDDVTKDDEDESEDDDYLSSFQMDANTSIN